ncbi:hypothetical protein TrST_g10380 [Triparma strigata]|uniref:G-protein coupled receptors family 3 profile domain-containing protein n=1 Tax=Triparma strigata TaxID=1606541 RepID=A0A9W7F485_9STRA|nr:hypothetical protein TrST_g10380 [Triparma strigata]
MNPLLPLLFFVVVELARGAAGPSGGADFCKSQGYEWTVQPDDNTCMSRCYNNIGGTTVGDDFCAYTTWGNDRTSWDYSTLTGPRGLSPFAVGTQTCTERNSDNVCTLWQSSIHYDTCKKYAAHAQWAALYYKYGYKTEISCAECRPGFKSETADYYSQPGGPFVKYCVGAEVKMKEETGAKNAGVEFELLTNIFGNVPNMLATSETSYEDNNNPWVGVYKEGDEPGTADATEWQWLLDRNQNSKFTLDEPGYYFATILADKESYKELSDRLVFTVDSADGTAPSAPPITAPAWVSPQDSVFVSYVLDDPMYYPVINTWLSIFIDDGEAPTSSNEKGWHRIHEGDNIGSTRFTPSSGWTPGPYYVVLTTQGGSSWAPNNYVEISDRVYISINDGTNAPTEAPSKSPTMKPTNAPTVAPTKAPTRSPTLAPTTSSPTRSECTNEEKSGDETDVDCGGQSCGGCEVNQKCILDRDCKSDTCLSGVCVAAPTQAPTMAPTQAPTTKAPTKAPTEAPTQAPTTAPTAKPTTGAPTPSTAPTTLMPTPIGYIATCDETNKCWTGNEPCCNTITTNMFVTSVITERILFYDLKSSTYKKFLSHEAGQEDEGEDSGDGRGDEGGDKGGGNNKGGEGGKRRRLYLATQEVEAELGAGRRLNDAAFKTTSPVLEMDKTSHGTSQIAFSPTGQELYFTRSASSLNNEEGSLEAFHAQTGDHVNTVISSSVFQELSGSSTAFDPWALRVFSNDTVTLILFSDTPTRSVYFFEPSTEYFHKIFTSNVTSTPSCTVVDIAVQKKGVDEIVALILSQCVDPDENDQVHKVVFKTDWEENTINISSRTHLQTLPDKCAGRSIEFRDADDWRYYWVAFSPHASLQAQNPQHPHMYEYSADISSNTHEVPILTMADLEGSQRLGVDLGIIRRAPNGKIYATEKTFGLPLILDPTLDESRVIGQTGAQHGDLADSYSVAFNPNTFGLNSQVVMGAEFDLTNETIMAGVGYFFNVTLKNSENEDVLIYTYLEGSAEGMTSHGRSEVQIENFEHFDNTNVYQGKLEVESASQSATDEEHKWQLKVEIKGLSMLIGNPVSFWVQAGPTSPANTQLLSTYENVIAGQNRKIQVSTADKFGNVRNFNDTKGDDEDEKKFDVTDISNGATNGDFSYTISNVASGLFEIDIMTTKARAYTFEVKYGEEKIGNSPANVIFSPAVVNVSKSVAVGSSLEFFEGNSETSSDVESENFFIIYLRDDFYNIVPSASLMERINCTIIGLRPVQSKFVNIWSDNLKDELTEEAVKVNMESQSDGSIKVSFQIDSRKFVYAKLTATWEDENGDVDFIRYERVNDGTRGLVKLNEFRIEPYSVVDFRTVDAIDIYIITMLTGFVVLFTIVLLILVQWWRKENAIKFSQRRLLLLLLFGCLIINLTMVLGTVPAVNEWEWSCTMTVWGISIGFFLVKLVLLAKLYRVKTLAFAKANKKVKVTDGYLLVRIAAAVVLLIAYLTAASWIERIKLEKKVTEDVMKTDSKGTKHFYEIQQCQYSETIVWLPLYFVHLALIFLVAILAFQTRKLSTAFSESRYIFHAINNLVICLLLIGILVYDPDMPFKSPKMYLMAMHIPLIFGILVFEAVMFIPKFRFILKGTKIELTDLTKGMDKSGMEMGPMRSRGESMDTFETRSTISSKTGSKQLLDFRQSNSGGGGIKTGKFTGGGVAVGSFQKKTPAFGKRDSSNGEMSSFSSATDNPLAVQQQIDVAVKKVKEKHKKEVDKLKKLVVSLKEELAASNAVVKKDEEALGWSREKSASTVEMDMPDKGSEWKVDHDSNGYPFYTHPDGRCQYERPKDWWE